MTEKQVYNLIDYYIKNCNQNIPIMSTLLSLLAILISLISVVYINKQYKQSIRNRLLTTWNNILDICNNNSFLFNIQKTEHYWSRMDTQEKHQYAAFCHLVWNFIYDIIIHKFSSFENFNAIIHLVTAYHYHWLERNPTFFPSQKFWDIIDSKKGSPHLIYRHDGILPTKNNDLDWEIIAKDYHNYILGPFADEMLEKINKKNNINARRNLLIDYIYQNYATTLKHKSIADFGCGPGNLIPHLKNLTKKITGIDKSKVALEIAKEVAKKNGIEFIKYNVEFEEINQKDKFDLIIAVNSILPNSREEVNTILLKIYQLLKKDGTLLAILPSFDTIDNLISLWKNHYTDVFKDENHAKRIINAYKTNKQYNSEVKSFADDGQKSQCYHTLETILDEFKNAGFVLINDPKKILYPWNLANKFDYGNFNNKDEAIWDWFVVAKKK